MCTLLTVSRNLWKTDRDNLIMRVIQDSVMNADGLTLVCVDVDEPDLDIKVSAMKITPIVKAIDDFCSNASESGRIFLHSRAATTYAIGIAFNHGFTDHKGTIIMHNGIIDNPTRLSVDSFNLTTYNTSDTQETLDDLMYMEERFANLFLIRPEDNNYGVVRLQAGQLHTDEQGNYSTHATGRILTPVQPWSCQDHDLGKLKVAPVNTRDYWDSWDSEYMFSPPYRKAK
jgi:predicted glutamine amidotransferase